MVRRMTLALLLLTFALGCLLPGIEGGFVLCVDRGPGGHVALESGPCGPGPGADPCGDAPPAPLLSSGNCGACFDIPLGMEGRVRPVPAAKDRPLDLPAPSAAADLPAIAFAPAGPAAPAAPDAPPPGSRTPLRLRL